MSVFSSPMDTPPSACWIKVGKSWVRVDETGNLDVEAAPQMGVRIIGVMKALQKTGASTSELISNSLSRLEPTLFWWNFAKPLGFDQ